MVTLLRSMPAPWSPRLVILIVAALAMVVLGLGIRIGAPSSDVEALAKTVLALVVASFGMFAVVSSLNARWAEADRARTRHLRGPAARMGRLPLWAYRVGLLLGGLFMTGLGVAGLISALVLTR